MNTNLYETINKLNANYENRIRKALSNKEDYDKLKTQLEDTYHTKVNTLQNAWDTEKAKLLESVREIEKNTKLTDWEPFVNKLDSKYASKMDKLNNQTIIEQTVKSLLVDDNQFINSIIKTPAGNNSFKFNIATFFYMVANNFMKFRVDFSKASDSNILATTRPSGLTIENNLEWVVKNLPRKNNFITFTQITSQNIKSESPENTTSFYINRKYALYCLRNISRLTLDNYFGLDQAALMNSDEHISSQDELLSALWGYYALENKVIVINHLSLQEASGNDKLDMQRLRRNKELVLQQGEKILKKLKLSIKKFPFQPLTSIPQEFYPNSTLDSLNLPINPNNTAFNVFDLLDMFYDGFLSNFTQQQQQLLKLAFVSSTLDATDALMGNLNLNLKVPKTNQFWIGEAPLCNAKPEDCLKYGAGLYRAVPESQITEHDKLNYGSGCWTGNKVLCRIDNDELARQGILDRFEIDPKKDDFELRWFGTAPICGANACDALQEGFIPVLSDKIGDGSKCIKGSKYLGLRRSKFRPQDKKFIDDTRMKCLDLSIDNEKFWNSIIKDTFSIAKSVVDVITKIV